MKDERRTPDKEIKFAENYGKIKINQCFTPVDAYPKSAMVLK